MRPTARAPGFSLIEMTVSMAITAGLFALVLQLIAAMQRDFGTEPELMDVQQRLRVVVDMLSHDLQMAGAGLNTSPPDGMLTDYVPPVRPAATGPMHRDGELVHWSDRITIAYRQERPPSGGDVSALERRVYYHDPGARRLMLYDGGASDLPLADDVTGLAFSYFADPSARSVPVPSGGTASCLYRAGEPAMPLLREFAGAAPVTLTSRDLTDGPICGASPERFDGDLLRIRLIRVRIRVATPPGRRVRVEQEVSFDVAPRNFNLLPRSPSE